MDDFDGFELEISSLGEATPPKGSAEEEGYDAPQAENVDGVGVASPGTHAGTRGASYWRVIRAVIVGVCVLSALALVLARSPETLAIVGNMLGIETPTPTIPLTLGMEKIYPIYSVPWGTLRVDGRVQTFEVQPGHYQPIRLSRGRHVLEYRAALFPTLRCTVSAPAAAVDTCPLVDISSLFFDPVPQEVRGLAREIDLGAKPERLPADQRAALAAAIDLAARGGTSYQTSVMPGERYAVAPDRIAVSSQALTATLTAKRVQSAESVVGRYPIGSPVPCADVCVDVLPGNGDASRWNLNFAASLGWRYTTADGHIVAEAPLLAPQMPTVGVYVVAQAQASWVHEQWVVQSISSNVSDSVCGIAQYLMEGLYADLKVSAQEAAQNNGTRVGIQGSPHPADGCYVTYLRLKSDGTHEPEAGFLYRLGVLLTVTPEAQRLFPALPVADAHDRAIVSQTHAPGQP